MSVRAVIFDLFDTLVDLHMENLPRVTLGKRQIPSTLGALHAQIVRHVDMEIEEFLNIVREVDKISRETRYKQGLEFPTLQRFEEICERLGTDDPDLPETLTRTHMRAIQDQVRYLPHHVDLLRELRDAGLKTAVCSNFSHAPTGLDVIEEAGLTEQLDEVVISVDVAYRKPRAEIFEETLRRLSIAPDEGIHVGDNLDADVDGAAKLGIRTVWVTRRVSDPRVHLERHKGRAPEFVVSDLREIPGIAVAGCAS